MNLKDIFNGEAMTYEQFIAKTTENKAKFVDLSEGNYVSNQKYTDELAARDTRISTLDETIKTRDTDLANLRTQLETAGTDATKLNEVTTKFTDLQKQYDKDTKAYQEQLKEQAYQFAVKEFANKQKFTSQAAKRDFVSTMLSKNLQIDGDTIIGATDFVESYSKENEDAFVKETPNNEPINKPKFVNTTNPQTNIDTGNEDLFGFNFNGVR